MDRNVHKLNRGKRPNLAKVGIAWLQNCDRPLDEEELGEMSIEIQWGTLESTNLLKKGPTKGEEKGRAQ